MKNKKYCRICGKEMFLRDSGYFDEKTGFPEQEYFCIDKNECSHGNHDDKKEWWNDNGYKCRKCGRRNSSSFIG